MLRRCLLLGRQRFRQPFRLCLRLSQSLISLSIMRQHSVTALTGNHLHGVVSSTARFTDTVVFSHAATSTLDGSRTKELVAAEQQTPFVALLHSIRSQGLPWIFWCHAPHVLLHFIVFVRLRIRIHRSFFCTTCCSLRRCFRRSAKFLPQLCNFFVQ